MPESSRWWKVTADLGFFQDKRHLEVRSHSEACLHIKTQHSLEVSQGQPCFTSKIWQDGASLPIPVRGYCICLVINIAKTWHQVWKRSHGVTYSKLAVEPYSTFKVLIKGCQAIDCFVPDMHLEWMHTVGPNQSLSNINNWTTPRDGSSITCFLDFVAKFIKLIYFIGSPLKRKMEI